MLAKNCQFESGKSAAYEITFITPVSEPLNLSEDFDVKAEDRFTLEWTRPLDDGGDKTLVYSVWELESDGTWEELTNRPSIEERRLSEIGDRFS